MIQEILTYIIIAVSVIYTLSGFKNIFLPSKNKKTNCSAGCSGCALNKNTVSKKIEVKILK